MSSSIERKLAAIMFTDIVGYTEQMSKNEDKTFALIQKKRDILLPLIEKYEGKLIKEIGDGTLTRYFKANNAIGCATSFQGQTDKDLKIRAGIHMGEVIVDKEDVFGDVVNVASRLESIAVPGSILVSQETIDKLEMTDKVGLVSLGMQSLKGVGRLIEVYAIKHKNLIVPSPNDYTENKIKVHSDDEVPSIAIIPFENKGKEEDAFYAYGISADLISDVSSAGLIRVASKKQIDEAGDLPQNELAKKLVVRYMTNGELWRMGDMFQLSIELYDTKDKKVIWSDRWQEKWDNLSSIKMNLSDGLLKALDRTSKAENKVETTNTEAYKLYLKAKHIYEKRENQDDVKSTRKLLNNAIELDGNLISAKVLFGTTYMEVGDYDEAIKIFNLTLQLAKDIGNKGEIAISLGNIGQVYHHKGDNDKALDYSNKALPIFEELGDKLQILLSLNNIGILYYHKSDYDKSLTYYKRALVIANELSNKFGMGKVLINIAGVHRDKGDLNTAIDYCKRSIAISDDIGDKHSTSGALSNIGSLHYDKGEYDKALDYYEKGLAIDKELGNKPGMGHKLNSIGIVHESNADYNKALSYYKRALAIAKEIGNKSGIGYILNGFGNVHMSRGDYDKALSYYKRALIIAKEMGNKVGMGMRINNIGILYTNKGHYDKALDYCTKSLKIFETLEHKHGILTSLYSIAILHYDKDDYDKALQYFEKIITIQKNIGIKKLGLETTIYSFLTYRQLVKEYNIKEIYSLIKNTKNIEYRINFRLYELLEDKSYLETAYNQVQEKASGMEDKLKIKFLSYPIPKAIVEEYNKVFKNK